MRVEAERCQGPEFQMSEASGGVGLVARRSSAELACAEFATPYVLARCVGGRGSRPRSPIRTRWRPFKGGAIAAR